MTGKDLEDWLEEELIKANLVYDREGERNAYSHKPGKGKADFKIHGKALVECKVIEKLSNLTLPGINPKTGKEYKSPKIPRHQIRALRSYGSNGWILCMETSTECLYCINMDVYEQAVIDNPRIRTLKGCMTKITMEKFICILQNSSI